MPTRPLNSLDVVKRLKPDFPCAVLVYCPEVVVTGEAPDAPLIWPIPPDMKILRTRMPPLLLSLVLLVAVEAYFFDLLRFAAALDVPLASLMAEV